MPTATPAIDGNVWVISLAVVDALRVSTSKSDRLSWPPPAKPEPAIKPAEPIDYAQVDAEAEKKVRRAYAKAPDLCQRHGMHKAWTKDGRSLEVPAMTARSMVAPEEDERPPSLIILQGVAPV